MRRLSTYGILLVVAALFGACDSGGDDPTEAELFVGTWTLVRVEDATGDRTSAVQALGELRTTFEADGTYELVFDRTQGDDQRQDNTYLLNEVNNNLTLNANNPITGGTLAVPVTYAFNGEDEIVLTLESTFAQLINIALGNAFGEVQGNVELTIRRTS